MGMSVQEIVYEYKTGLSSRPEYYSGRGNNTGDLNSEMLEKVWIGIKTECGAEAATAMVNMVNDLNDTSATGFLLALYALERNGWKHTRANVPANDADAFAEMASDMNRRLQRAAESGDAEAKRNAEVDQSAVMMGMINIMFGVSAGGQKEGHSTAVTGKFLSQHSDDISGKVRDLRGGDFMYGFSHR